jgi:hypothetical protein
MKLISLLLLMFSLNSFAKPLVQESYFVYDQDKQELKNLVAQYDLIIDHMSPIGYEGLM